MTTEILGALKRGERSKPPRPRSSKEPTKKKPDLAIESDNSLSMQDAAHMPTPSEPHLFLNDEANENLKVEVLKEFDLQREEWRFKCKFSEDRSNLAKIKYTVEVTYKNKTDHVGFTKLPTKRRWMVYYLRECIGIFMEKDK